MILNRQLNNFKLLTLGYSESGKTYYLGSLHQMRSGRGPHLFSIRSEDNAVQTKIEEIYEVLIKTKSGIIGTTPKIESGKIVFKKKQTPLINIEITDIYGQASKSGKDVAAARLLIKTIPSQDGVAIFIQTPKNDKEYNSAIEQLNRHLDLTENLINGKRKIPIALILTQLDKLESLNGLNEEVERQVNEFKAQYSYESEIPKQGVIFTKTDTINSFVKEVVDSEYVNDIVEHFYSHLKGYDNVARRVFPSSSLGFDNAIRNPAGGVTEVAKDGKLSPYGNILSFLWTIYAFNKLNPGRIVENDSFKSSDLLEEMHYLFATGQAYDDKSSPIWNSRNIADLTMNI